MHAPRNTGGLLNDDLDAGVKVSRGDSRKEVTMSDNLKSQESIMLNLIRGLLDDLGMQHMVSPKETNRDYESLVSRTQTEGLSFLTKTLPKYGKALDKALLAEKFTPMSEFGHDKGVAYPKLFKGLAKLIFEEDGVLRDSPDIAAIQSLRQVSYAFYKYDLPYQDITVRLTIEEFRDIERNINPIPQTGENVSTIYFAQEVLNEIFSTFDSELHYSGHTLKPKNGPGAVAHGEKPWQRYEPHRCYSSLDELVSYGSFFYYNDRHLFDHWASYFDLPCLQKPGTAVLLAVPKDSRGPRLISKEPQEYMAYQQALARPLMDHIETHPLTRGHVNFKDQSINGALALRASADGSLATLDLSAASDRLSKELVETLFEDLPTLQKWLMGARSWYTELPDGHRLKLKKYGPMGSALTFPIQSVVFYSLLVGALVRDGRSLRDAAASVYVYGDDIIISNEHARMAIETLESMGLKVNTDKSCYSGRFRESCGIDAYGGVEVTPVKFKKVWTDKPEITTLQAWVAYSNDLFRKGYWKASDVCKTLVEKALGKKLPLVTPTSPLLGLETWSRDHAIEANEPIAKWSHDLQCNVYPGYASKVQAKRWIKCGWQRLLNWAWNSTLDEECESPYNWDKQPFDTGLFTVRHSVAKHYVEVAESSL